MDCYYRFVVDPSPALEASPRIAQTTGHCGVSYGIEDVYIKRDD